MFFQGHVLSSDEDRVWRDGTLLKYDDWTGIEPNGIPLGELHSMFDAASTYDVGVAQNGRPGCEKGKTNSVLLVWFPFSYNYRNKITFDSVI